MAWGEQTDGDLVAAARAGESAAWDALVERLESRVWAVARAYRLDRADAQDVCQVTWLQLLTHLDGIREPDRVSAWVAATARNESLRVLRRNGRQIPTSDDAFDAADSAAPEPDAAMLADERQKAVWVALSTLSARCQRLLRLFLADPPPTYEEVSIILDMPIGSIGPTRGRCLESLRQRLAHGGGPTGPLSQEMAT